MGWRPDSSPGVLLWRASNLWQRRLRRALGKHGLTQAQFLILASLKVFEEEGRSAAQRDLATFSGLDVAAVSIVLGQLAEKGYVTRRRGTDARVRHPTLTEAGAKIAATVAPEANANDSELFSPLGENTPMFRGALQMLLGMRPRILSR